MPRHYPLAFIPFLFACADQPTPTAPETSAIPTAASSAAGEGHLIYAVDAANTLVSFTTGKANQQRSSTAITGLEPGERIVGIDFRPSAVAPADPSVIGRLYGVSSASKVYLIDPLTGTASNGRALVTATGIPVTLSGTGFGVGFNPVPDRLRVHSDTDQNLRINVEDGVTAVDTTLTYPADGVDPRIAGTAYTNSDNDPATLTTLYAIDAGRDALTVFDIPSGPNSGRMSVVGSLGVDAGDLTGFDIDGATGEAFATFTNSPSGKPTLYRVDLGTGAATRLQLMAGSAPLVSIALAP
jgi:Domain of unknown function (DUF4394)